jgi:hypothetical protein
MDYYLFVGWMTFLFVVRLFAVDFKQSRGFFQRRSIITRERRKNRYYVDSTFFQCLAWIVVQSFNPSWWSSAREIGTRRFPNFSIRDRQLISPSQRWFLIPNYYSAFLCAVCLCRWFLAHDNTSDGKTIFSLSSDKFERPQSPPVPSYCSICCSDMQNQTRAASRKLHPKCFHQLPIRPLLACCRFKIYQDKIDQLLFSLVRYNRLSVSEGYVRALP